MIFNCMFVFFCYDNNIFNIGFNSFFNYVLNGWFINDRKYFFWYCFCSW